MAFKEVPSKVDFVKLEKAMLAFWQTTDAFNTLRALRAKSDKQWSFIDGPITANNPMGVHHAWGRTYKDLYQRFKAMQGFNQRWQNGFDCQGLWVEVNVERELGFNSKRDIEAYGLDRFVKQCKMRVLEYAAVQTEQSIRLGYWMDWNDTTQLQYLRSQLAKAPEEEISIQGVEGPLTGTIEQLVGRLGEPEMGGSYFTFSDENNYQIWGFLKNCHENGWIYKGRDVMPWCARCGTGISQHEIVTDGYMEITHDSVFLRFPIISKGDRGKKTAADPGTREALLIWTTTPWTLTSNVAAAVGPDLIYVKVRQKEDGWIYYLAKDALSNTMIGEYELIEEMRGAELVGWEYEGPFDDLTAAKKAFDEVGYTHRVISWTEVGSDEGTGIVHIAPGCGAEDFELSRENNLPVIAPLNESGIYVDDFDWLTGEFVADVTEEIFNDLRRKGIYYRKQRYPHRYPHCWRCGEELVYRLVDEWFINTGPLYDKPRSEVTEEEKSRSWRYQIMDVVDEINWIPSYGREREMDWLRNMQDWMISKKRYYGLALPIWVCDDPGCAHFHVVGSEHELEERAIDGWDVFQGHSPHRPYIDAVKIACPSCGGVATRIRDVGDPWLDAGIVPFSTLQYRDHPEFWEKWFPADFITESFPGQFRNWFYSLLAQSTALTRRPPFLNIFGYASLLAEDGREMHKSWGNAIEFNEAADNMGADTMRWLFASHKPEQNLLFGYNSGDETRRRFMIPLWNVYSFFVTYARIDHWKPAGKDGAIVTLPSSNSANAQMDQWILARLNEVTVQTTNALNEFRAEKATVFLEAFLDDLSNWYVRRSRRRFWKSEADADKMAAYQTLYTVMVQYAKLLAPFVPFTAEAIYQNLVRGFDPDAPVSIHHCDWPEWYDSDDDLSLLNKMRLAINVASLGRSARGTANLKLRQPLARARVHVGTQQERDDLVSLVDVLTEEINVKEIEIASEVGELVKYRLMPNNRVLGPKFGALFPKIRQALDEVDPVQGSQELQSGRSLELIVDDKPISLGNEDVIIQTESRGGLAVTSDRGITVAVDTTLTDSLKQEGIARDLVRLVNTMRKDAGLALDDRIDLRYSAGVEISQAIEVFNDYIRQETLSVSLESGELEEAEHRRTETLNGDALVLTMRRTS